MKKEIRLNFPVSSNENHTVPVSYDGCTCIDMSSNGLFALPHANMFPSCTQLDISDNQLTRLSSILPLSKRLTHLNVSRNKINNVSHIISFTELRTLNISSNLITVIPPYHGSLMLLDLSHNSFDILPSLSSLHLLETLNLSANEISDLSCASSLLPKSIKFMNLSSNKIDLLTSLYHLSFLALHSLCIQSNPCILPSKFNHHPFIFALFYESLVEVDGMVLLEEEVLLGEKMLQDKIWKFKREGSEKENEMREYLALHSPPINSFDNDPSFDTRMAKVIEKRREHENSLRSDSSFTHLSDSRSLSLHSPYSNWTRTVLNQKENLSEDISNSITHYQNNRIEDYEEKKIAINYFVEGIQERKRTPPKPKPRISRDCNMKRAVVIIQRWWRNKKKDRKEEKERIRKENRTSENEEKEKKEMKYVMEALIDTAAMQAECTEKLEEMLNKQIERINALESLLTPPPPTNLTIDYTCGLTRLSWNPPPPVDLYEIYVDGRLEGHVNGRSSSVILSNIPSSSIIQLKAIRGSLTSSLSKSVPD